MNPFTAESTSAAGHTINQNNRVQFKQAKCLAPFQNFQDSRKDAVQVNNDVVASKGLSLAQELWEGN